MKKLFLLTALACFAMACNNPASNNQNATTASNTAPISNENLPDLNKPEDIAMDFKKAIFANDYVAAKKIFLPSRMNDLNEIETYWRQYITDTADAEIFIGLVNKATCYKNAENKNKAYCLICCDAEGGKEVIHVEKLDRTWYISMNAKDFEYEQYSKYLEPHILED